MKEELKFNHSGNFGDIVYSIPFCLQTLKDYEGDKFSFNLQTNCPAQYFGGSHPCGKVRMNENVAKALKPLLQSQKYIGNITISDKCPDGYYNLDKFRSINHISFSSGHIAQWYNILSFSMVQIPDVWNPWIFIEKDFDIGEKKIVLFRSLRYRRKNLNYSFLRKYSDIILFIGLEEEKKDFENNFFKVDFYKIKDFYEAAKIMMSAKLVIGNQTGLFSIAEAMKVNRLLETAYECPNVIMLGGNAQYVVHSSQFMEVFNSFYNAFIK